MKNHLKLSSFTAKIGVQIKNFDLLETAFTHRSFINEINDKAREHNERLEFLGDAVLELIITEHLFNNYPDHAEGELTSFRAAIVRTNALAKFARELGYGELLEMSKGEQATGGRDKDYLLANTFEAVLGAIYLDQGYEIAKDFINRTLVPHINEIVEKRLDIDAKSRFQEIVQKIIKQTPTYKVLKEEGPDHEKTFTVGVFIGADQYGEGVGGSKQIAEEAAAEEGIKRVSKDKNFITA